MKIRQIVVAVAAGLLAMVAGAGAVVVDEYDEAFRQVMLSVEPASAVRELRVVWGDRDYGADPTKWPHEGRAGDIAAPSIESIRQ